MKRFPHSGDTTQSNVRFNDDHLWEPLWGRELQSLVDQTTIAEIGIPSLVLMENAGKAVALHIAHDATDQRAIIILAGLGNNGGDALVAARYLSESGFEPNVFLVASDQNELNTKASADCLRQVKILQALGINLTFYQPGCFQQFREKALVICDGIFGNGFRGPMRDGLAKSALREAEKLTNKTVIAIDVPSGLDGDLAQPQDIPLIADVTVSFGQAKFALVTSPARQVVGKLVIEDIGFPKKAIAHAMTLQPPFVSSAKNETILNNNPWRLLSPEANKYDRGHVLVIGGSLGKTGAPILSAKAALRCGAGWVTISVPKDCRKEVQSFLEATEEELFHENHLDADCLRRFIAQRKVRALVIGPGMVESPWSTALWEVFHEFVHHKNGFVVVDAGAMHAISDYLTKSPMRADRFLLTPHPGEWHKIGELPKDALSREHLTQSQAFAKSWGSSFVYKGPTPIIISGEDSELPVVTTAGGVELARAGSGDVYAGLCAAHGCQGYSAKFAACRAAILLAAAARTASERLGIHSVLATDIIDSVGLF